MTELIITEKPSSANKVALALADSKPTKKNNKGVPYYVLTKNGKEIIVCSAVGHLFRLDQTSKNKAWTYPVFDIAWKESGDTKDTKYVKAYIQTIKMLAKNAKEFTLATDYDVEGEVIGLNIIRFLCKQKDANRMKFSTLTKPDLVKAYDGKASHINWGQAYAGETRHFLDWLYGINLSRALTLAVKNATNRYKLLTIGRVQGPALKIIVDREKEILAFKPTPYWQIQMLAVAKGTEFESWHVKDKFLDKNEALAVLEKVKDKNAVVKKVETKEFKQAPPTPFDLTTLQTESYRVLKFPPKKTLSLAQNLYTAGVISYPRTSSQKLPKEIGYKKILEQLKKQSNYKQLSSRLLELKSLKPNNGKKDDPAHPAIFPTGIVPAEKTTPDELKLYDLIVKRFLATFADPAVRETLNITLVIMDEEFIAKGTRTKVKAWHEFYQPYVKLEETEFVDVSEGETVNVKTINLLDKETQPPKRYTPASIIKELEKRGLGTKATRSEIVDTLFKRNYVEDKSIKATQLGMDLIEILSKYCPKIIDEELTRNFEKEMQEIFNNKKTEQEVLEEAKKVLTKILSEFKQKELDIGKELGKANAETDSKQKTVGNCPSCNGMLVIKRGKFGRFIACDNYPDCKVTFKLPQKGTIRVTKDLCDKCNYPKLKITNKGKTQELCINPECSSKSETANSYADEGKPCPQCKKGTLVLRKSFYGSFLGCSNYPKCKYVKKIE